MLLCVMINANRVNAEEKIGVKYYYVELIRMKLGVLSMEPVDEEFRLFSSMRLVKKWLTDNGFIYGQRSFFNYPTGDREWFHKDDISMEYVDVIITKMNLDDRAESKFKSLGEIHREWLPKFLKELEEAKSEED